MFQTPEIFTST